MTDIFMMTYNRPGLLAKTTEHLFKRTTTPFHLHIVDDGSQTGGSVLLNLVGHDRVETMVLRANNLGVPNNLRLMEGLTASDPVVLMGDDHLCPLVEPDWLTRGLMAIEEHPEMGMLALNDPSCNTNNRRHVKERTSPITICEFIGGTFLFIRRAILETFKYPKDWGNVQSPLKSWAKHARYLGFEAGYLVDTYCQHIGTFSARMGIDIGEQLIRPIDPITLRPEEVYAW